MRQIDWSMIPCGEPSSKKSLSRDQSNFYQLILYSLRLIFAMEEADWRKLKSFWSQHIGIYWSTILKKTRRAAPTTAWSPRKRLNNIEQDFTKLLEDYSWLKADQKLTRRPSTSFQRPSSWNAQNSARRAFSSAAVTSTWESFSEQMTNLPKRRASSLK